VFVVSRNTAAEQGEMLPGATTPGLLLFDPVIFSKLREFVETKCRLRQCRF